MKSGRPADGAPIDFQGRIQQAKTQLEDMIDLHPEGMLLIDSRNRILRVNRALLGLVDMRSYGDILGRDLDEAFPVASGDGQIALLSTILGRAKQAPEVAVTLHTGKRRVLHFSPHAAVTPGGVWVLTVRDPSSEKLEALRRERRHKKEAVKALVGALMHHINQPLTVLIVRARLMQMAISQGTATMPDLEIGVQEIAALSLQISEILKKVDGREDYETEEYTKGVDILRIDP